MYVSSANTNLKQMSTNVVGVKFRYELDSTIRDSILLNVFKRKLKYEYFRNY